MTKPDLKSKPPTKFNNTGTLTFAKLPLAMILIHLGLWLALALGFDLGSDEAHYVLYGRHLDWSYFDHPPLVGWLQALGVLICDNLDLSPITWRLVYRLPALLATLWTWKELSSLFPQIEKRLLTFQWAPVPFLMSLFWLPDTILLPIALTIARVLTQSAQSKNFLKLGVLIGLAGLSKYTAILIVPGLASVMLKNLITKKWTLNHLALTLAPAALFMVPIVYWNATHAWISFRYQWEHILGDKDLSGTYFVGTLLSQALGYGVLLTFILTGKAVFLFTQEVVFLLRNKMACFFQPWEKFLKYVYVQLDQWSSTYKESTRSLLKKCSDGHLYLSMTSVITLIFFFKVSLTTFVLPHWTLLGWWGLYGLLWKQVKEKWHKAQMILNSIFFLLLLSILWLPIDFKHRINLSEVLGWPSLMVKVFTMIGPTEPLYLTNWSYGSRARLYAPRGEEDRVLILDQRRDQFDLWEKNQNKDAPFWVLLFKKDQPAWLKNLVPYCHEAHPDQKVEDSNHRKWKHEFSLWYCVKTPIW